jgi:hypothetical protein
MAVQIQGACVTHHYIKAGQGNMSWKKLAGRTEMEEECTYFPKIFECIAYHVGVVQIPPVQNKTIQNASQQLNIRMEGLQRQSPIQPTKGCYNTKISVTFL